MEAIIPNQQTSSAHKRLVPVSSKHHHQMSQSDLFSDLRILHKARMAYCLTHALEIGEMEIKSRKNTLQ